MDRPENDAPSSQQVGDDAAAERAAPEPALPLPQGTAAEGTAAEGTAAEGAVAVIRLNLIAAPLQSQTVAMLHDALQRWARSPDVYAVVMHFRSAPIDPQRSRRPEPDQSIATVGDQLALAWQIDCFPKPIVALLDGPVTAPVIGLISFITHRVGGENFQLLLPDAADFTVPPAGGIAHILSRIPAARGRDWALTGRPIDRAEALAAGFLTHCVAATAFPEIVAALATAHPVDPLLDCLHSDPQPDPDIPSDATLARWFAHASIATIGAALANETGPAATCARTASAALARQQPLALAGLLRLLALSADVDRRQALLLTYRLAQSLRAESAVTAPGTPAEAARLFEVPKAGDLALPPGSAIAQARF